MLGQGYVHQQGQLYYLVVPPQESVLMVLKDVGQSQHGNVLMECHFLPQHSRSLKLLRKLVILLFTLESGIWENFSQKNNKNPTYAYKKWPVSH